MSEIQEILNYYNQLLDVETFLVDNSGVIQVHTDEFIIEQQNFFDDLDYKNYKEQIISNVKEFEMITIDKENIEYYLISRYIEELDWYLIAIKDTSALVKSFKRQIVTDFIIILVVVFFVILLTMKVINYYQSKLSYFAATDVLTKLKNRRSMDIQIERNINEYNNQKLFSLFIIDIDNFKKINDAYGHVFGDIVIKKVVEVTLKCIGSESTLSRWGGDEFVGILHYNINDAKATLLKLKEEIENNTLLSQHGVTISIGVTEYKQGLTTDNLIINADKALYLAKENGKNQVEVTQ